ncbi:hypothetical protein [Streptomyces qinzhouensis]|uniref:Lipoprotein n=1 Tax=Streptomyces qinzhouensis TaxID=2599401 RepID=A0A5B8JEU9_9ACTN|nr:hypothetical protein [Streptomyces qinzhouensis]QDY79976.1 hypothetical protein FQU76_29385 [Streptomyces qinzhouensis]
MRRRAVRAAALAALLALASVGCDWGIDSAPIDARGLTGDWANEAGARFAFRADGTAAGTGLHSSLPPKTACPDILSGTWEFMGIEVREGEEPPQNPDGSLAMGDTIDFVEPDAGSACSVFLSAGRDERGFGLCLTEDPEISCTDRELLRRTDGAEPESPR